MRRGEDGAFTADIEAIVAAIRPATRIVALTNPGNPTGYMWTGDELKTVAHAARRVGGTLLVNEVYDKLILDARRTHVGAIAAAGLDGVVVIGGVAKCYDMTGFHLGWIVADAGLVAAMSDLRFLTHQAEPPAVSQHAALAALTPPIRDEHPARSRAMLLANAQATTAALTGLSGVRCPVPAAGQFAFPYVGGDDQAVAEALKRDAGVCVVPGGAWGRMGMGHLRIALANPADLHAEGLRRLRAGLADRRT
jgi:aspartate/methionine/tyrosine aminotransferase